MSAAEDLNPTRFIIGFPQIHTAAAYTVGRRSDANCSPHPGPSSGPIVGVFFCAARLVQTPKIAGALPEVIGDLDRLPEAALQNGRHSSSLDFQKRFMISFAPNLVLKARHRKTVFRAFLSLAAGFVLAVGANATEVENGPEVAGFRGEVTGAVKSAQEDGRVFVLVIKKAEVDAAGTSSLKDSAPLLGKELSIGVRMPKNADGVGSPHPDDVAYIKTLKPGMVISVRIFSVHNNPQVLRIQSPGHSVEGTQPRSESEKKKTVEKP